jgi:hypothetical protein
MDYDKEHIAVLKDHIATLKEANKMLEAWYKQELANKELLKVALYCALYLIAQQRNKR